MASPEQNAKTRAQSLIVQEGDFILSRRAIPHAQEIITRPDIAKEHGLQTLNIQELNSYLNFLELVILNERIISPDAYDFSGYITVLRCFQNSMDK
jgi:hypothetical protein